jgi:hypothetical protein
MKNFYFENYENSGEQNLIEDLVIESIKIYGIDCWYLPRKALNKDSLMNEMASSIVEGAYMIEMYVKNVDGFEGEGDFLSKFGLQIRDSMTLTVANRTFEAEISSIDAGRPRPLEGDLLYFPLNNKIFEIMHVEHESIFYQMGSLQTYDLRCELFEYSGEVVDTGHAAIDSVFREFSNFDSYTQDDLSFVLSVNDTGDNIETTIPALLRQFYSTTNQAHVYENRTYKFDISSQRNTDYEIRPYYASGSLYDDYTISGAPGQAGASLSVYIHDHTLGDIAIRLGDVGTLTLKIMQSLDTIEGISGFDESADNQTIESEADNILDFSEENPFGEDVY